MLIAGWQAVARGFLFAQARVGEAIKGNLADMVRGGGFKDRILEGDDGEAGPFEATVF